MCSAIAVSTAVRSRDKDNVRSTAVEEQLKQKKSNFMNPAPLPVLDLSWALLRVQHHLPPLHLAWTLDSLRCLFSFFLNNLSCLAYFREIYRLNLLFRSSSSFIFSSSLYFPYGTQILRSPLSRIQRYQRFSHLRYDVPSMNFLDITFTCVLGGSYLPECGICWACDVCLAVNQSFLRRMVKHIIVIVYVCRHMPIDCITT